MNKNELNEVDLLLRDLRRKYLEAYLGMLIYHHIDCRRVSFRDFLIHICGFARKT